MLSYQAHNNFHIDNIKALNKIEKCFYITTWMKVQTLNTHVLFMEVLFSYNLYTLYFHSGYRKQAINYQLMEKSKNYDFCRDKTYEHQQDTDLGF